MSVFPSSLPDTTHSWARCHTWYSEHLNICLYCNFLWLWLTVATTTVWAMWGRGLWLSCIISLMPDTVEISKSLSVFLSPLQYYMWIWNSAVHFTVPQVHFRNSWCFYCDWFGEGSNYWQLPSLFWSFLFRFVQSLERLVFFFFGIYVINILIYVYSQVVVCS